MDSVTLLLGARDGAMEAARRRGHRVLVLAERTPSRRRRAGIDGFAKVSFRSNWEVLRAALSLIRGRPVAAVVAVTERAVVPAAWLRAVLEVPGTNRQTASLCHDKAQMKRRAQARGIPVADFLVVEFGTTAEEIVERLGLPLVIKPRTSSGSRGTVVARTLAEVRRAMAPGMLAEAFVSGVEMSVESFVAGGVVRFRNPTEYTIPGWASILPAPLPEADLAAVFALSDRVLAAFGVERGVAHLELFLTKDGPVFGEVALRPPGGHLMTLLAQAYGFDPWDAHLAVELGEDVDLPGAAERFAGAQILHPGPGMVTSLRGLGAAERVPGVDAVEVRVRRGDRVAAREGVGQEVGRILASGSSRDAVATSLRRAQTALRIVVAPALPKAA